MFVCFASVTEKDTNFKTIHDCSKQGSQTRGSLDAFMRDRKYLTKRLQKLFSIKLRPVWHYFLGMLPYNQFEFETPALKSLSLKMAVKLKAKSISSTHIFTQI